LNNYEMRNIPTFFDAPFGELKDLNIGTVAICGIFSDHFGGGNPGSRIAPRQIRYSNWPDEKKTNNKCLNNRVVDIGDLNVFPLEYHRNINILKEQCVKVLRTGSRLLSVGGDYSNTPAMVSGLVDSFSDLSVGVIRISRRLDIMKEKKEPLDVTRFGTSDKIINLIGQANNPLTLLGTSGTIAFEEMEFSSRALIIAAKDINRNLVEAFSQDFNEWARKFNAFYLSVDADVLLPGYLETTFKNSYTGFSVETLCNIINRLSHLTILAADFTGYVPEIDLTGREETIMAEQILGCMINALCKGGKDDSK